MFGTLLEELRIRSVVRRRRRSYAPVGGVRERLGVLAVVSLPVLAIACIVAIAYRQKTNVLAEQALAEHRRALDLRCLAENIYHEARGEPLIGQYAVAEVTLNRLRSRHFPDTVCEVVHDTRWDPLRRKRVAHFSWTEHADVLEAPKGPAWKQAKKVAAAVYDDLHMPVVPGALFYHATSIRPYWADSRKTLAKIGNHVFYREALLAHRMRVAPRGQQLR